MKFEIEDIIHKRLTKDDFKRKYFRYTKNTILFDTAPLFTLLIGRLPMTERDILLREFKYTNKHFEALEKFLKLMEIDLNKLVITPQILQELISHLQKSIKSIRQDATQKTVLLEFNRHHIEFLKQQKKEVNTFEILIDNRMCYLELADLSCLLYAKNEKYVTIITQDDDFHDEAAKQKKLNYENILAINFEKVAYNSEDIPSPSTWQ